jgi:tetratricopeptide (TPR) repeat protein
MKACPACQTPHEDDKKFCRQCGAALPAAGQAPPEVSARRQTLEGPLPRGKLKGGRLKWAILAGVLGGVVLAGLVVLWLGKGSFLIRVNQEARLSLWRGEEQLAAATGEQLLTPTLRLGTYELRVEKEGFKPIRHPLKVGFGGRQVEVRVELTPAYGGLRLTSDPPGARVVVRNYYQVKEAITPCELSEVQAVPSSVEVTLPGYSPFRRSLAIEADKVMDLGTVVFKGNLWVDSSPQEAEVFLDDSPKGTTPLKLEALPAKSYRLKVVKKDVGLYLGEISLEPGRTLNLGSLQLDGMGVVQVKSLPETSRVWLDGRDLGLTPLTTQVKAGEHVVKLEALGHSPHERPIKIKAGQLLDLGTITLARHTPSRFPEFRLEPPPGGPPAEEVLPSPKLKEAAPAPPPETQVAATRLFNEGRVLFKQNNFNAALEKFQEGLRLDPTQVYGHYMLGYTLNHLGRYQEALAAFQRALALNPRNALAFEGLSWTLNQLGRHQEAITASQQALNLRPDFPEPHFNLGIAHLALGNREQARYHYQKLKQLRSPKAELLGSHLDKSAGLPPPSGPKPGGQPGGDEFQVIRDYYRLVQEKNVPAAVSLYAAAKQPVVKRQLIENVARATQYYRMDQMIPLERSETRALIKTFLYHKKYNQPEEYWEINISLVKEPEGWRIWSTPGRRIR